MKRHGFTGFAENAVAERFLLALERLTLIKGEAGHGALTNATEGSHCLPVGVDRPVLVEREVSRQRIGNKRAALTGDERETLFEGGEPVHEVVRDGAVRELRRDGDHVLVLAAALEGGLRRHPCVGGVREPGRQIDVVAAEILDHPDVGDARREGPLPSGVDLVDLSEIALLEAPAQLDEGGVEPLDVTDRADEPATLECIDESLACLERMRDRFLDKSCLLYTSRCV